MVVVPTYSIPVKMIFTLLSPLETLLFGREDIKPKLRFKEHS
jgi:hypothetical protein